MYYQDTEEKESGACGGLNTKDQDASNLNCVENRLWITGDVVN